ncbi:hypothetical protein [Candidatus Poriferisocius sp.]|uniref:hypothetical protein n=1 Tax=Candidatus Poriferisocius sp. TaxID=3101276 RepID=UPI003B5224A8
MNQYLNAGGRIVGSAVIKYPFRDSHIAVHSMLCRPRPDWQHLIQIREGRFTGPTDIVRQLPFDIEISPHGSNRAVTFSRPRVSRASGEIVELAATERLRFPDGLTLEEPLRIKLAGSASYDPVGLTFNLETFVAAARSEPLAA